ncbi:Sec-independent protein translocase protein TatB [Sphingomonas sp. DT-207]|uniref:Sec-independent protein translocase protein TatB n=1 Tax=Sphingomonas sp. DT-207 TaxID=3396167 RepID=UPI003F1DF397
MLDVAPTELLLVAIVALLVIGPKDLPTAMRFVGRWVGKARGVARQFRSGFDSMVREAELAEMEKQWAAENERIMREHPPTPALPAPGEPGAEIDAGAEPVMVAQPAFKEETAEPAAARAIEPAPKPKRTRKPKAVAPTQDEPLP